MKKTLSYIFLLAACILAFGCNTDQPAPSRERTILSIAFEGQIGEAVITNIDAETGEIEFEIATALVQSLSSVHLTSFVPSYNSTATVHTGDALDLTGDASIVVTAESGETRTYKLLMTTFTETFAGCYAITGSQVVGGLGGTDGWGWGTMMLADPADKAWCWNDAGYGPQANYDDYMEIVCTKINDDGSTEGTCHVYGGADGKHWNCIFAGAVNKLNPGQDIDLHHFYRAIPIGESTWKRDYEANTITFTSAEGVSTVCQLIEGEVVLSATKKITIPDQALAFALKGDQTWNADFIYTDYQKFAVSPVYYAYMISKVASIPEASKTDGDEGDINIDPVDPVDPDDPVDPVDPPGPDDDPSQQLNGTYKVTSLKTLGGGGSTAFVENKDKSWEWNNSINSEYDNLLVVDLKNSKGTVDYQAGDDGAYWDYILVADKNKLETGDVDLSANFGQLPHGVSNVSVDMATGDITINSTVKAKALIPGTYTFAVEYAYASGQVTIPDGSIGLVFSCKLYPESEYTWDNAWAYSDFERFCLRPFYYLMIFQKQ